MRHVNTILFLWIQILQDENLQAISIKFYGINLLEHGRFHVALFHGLTYIAIRSGRLELLWICTVVLWNRPPPSLLNRAQALTG